MLLPSQSFLSPLAKPVDGAFRGDGVMSMLHVDNASRVRQLLRP